MNEKEMRVATGKAEISACKARLRDTENKLVAFQQRIAADRAKLESEIAKEKSALECELAVAKSNLSREEAYLQKCQSDLDSGYEQ